MDFPTMDFPTIEPNCSTNIRRMKKKVLMLGTSGSGKTSMRSIVFANYRAKDTKRLDTTIDVEHSHVRFLGNLVLNIWDCAGQDTFMDSYFNSPQENIFQNVDVLVYVFNMKSQDKELQKDFKYFQLCIKAIHEKSPSAKVFCLINKMDLLPTDVREKIYLERKNTITSLSKPMEISCFMTSIMDETLYGAWSSIIKQITPNIDRFEEPLKLFAEVTECDEVLLLERSTFLIVSSVVRVPREDESRWDKISQIVNVLKSSCNKVGTHFTSIELKNTNFFLYLDKFTENTFIMVLMADSTVSSVALSININYARKNFEKLDNKQEFNEVDSKLKNFSF